MEESPSKSEQRTKRVALVDLHTASPSYRAKMVYDAIPADIKENPWTIICFCIEYLSGTVEAFPWLVPFARKLNEFLYTAHYYTPNAIGIIKDIDTISDADEQGNFKS